MIKKIKTINNLAVFSAFEWDKSVLDAKNKVLEFKKNNIIYGRNYSGKTTLSRIIRAMETGTISDKYISPSFNVEIEDGADVTLQNLKSHGKTIRVFNEDFVRENLKFIINPEEHIESFAILGDDNNKIEEEIANLEFKLGSNEEENETGFYKEYKQLAKEFSTLKRNYSTAESNLGNKLNNKATDKKIGIRYQSSRFGDQNYNITKLRSDIDAVLAKDFIPADELKEKELSKVIEEKPLDDVQPSEKITFELSDLVSQTKPLLEKKILESGKIESLLKDAFMNRWVKEGYGLHKDRSNTCGFCGNSITDKRWIELNKHFDEESEKLERSIDDLIRRIEEEVKFKANAFNINTNLFYSKFHEQCNQIQAEYDKLIKVYISSLDSLKSQLNARKNDLLNERVFITIDENSSELLATLEKYEKLRGEANLFSKQLSTEKQNAQKLLRLKEVHDFVLTIKYQDELQTIADLKTEKDTAKTKQDNKWQAIESVKSEIDAKKRLLNDEEKGAKKVNEYLNNYFGHNFLSLRAIEQSDSFTGKKQIRFEIVRGDKKAHHLSEGECSLIAFCYFMAKLHDIETKGEKAIIWIDDPISSLDGNHVFFIYSLINSDIVTQGNYEQLFISTHNLDFFKYLKRLPGTQTTKETKTKYRYLVVQRESKNSSIHLMPKYLCDYVTEFNFLFEQIYKCATISRVDDDNHGYFYNFGNNARKFLEVFLFYKFPDGASDEEKYKRFFGTDLIPAILANRINNEYSHLCGVLERGGLPIEVPEMNATAKLIIDRIKTLDEGQYNSLLTSIGITPEITP
ncbi:MAG: AAA family ATPase [Proteobacteria bacterium]|nr:AAA family ATPase [Pseudomonadota bacterium]MBU1389629.1 AAA family ATPase [Pseudomonadota bacterium]MBU1542567.1 AAA family ATPase [Pseudomonadota bacterium]